MTARFLVGDVFDRIADLPDGSVDLVVTSPPFLALRSYLPADHPDKALEIGSEATPAEFLDVMLRLTAEWRRVLAPHGSIAVELGDTYSGSGGAGGDYGDGGLREGQQAFSGSARKRATNGVGDEYRPSRAGRGADWPEAKSKALIPELFRVGLAYGINPLTGTVSPAGRWRVRNVVTWCLDGDTVVYARTPKGVGPARLLHLAQNFQPGQWELWDGDRWTPVLGWSDTEASDAIEIEFRNGERISATRNHEWPTQRGLVRTDELTVGDVVESVTLPEPERGPVEGLPDEEVGWFLGTFLADGAFDSRDRIQIAGHIDETAARLPRLRRLAEAYDGTATAHHYDNTASIVVRSPILAAVVRRYLGGTSARNKSLRAAAWRRSNAFLDALLHGYLEGDGHWDAKNQRWRLGFTDNGWLARDLRVLAARLGYRCRVKRHPRDADPRGGRFAGTARFYHRGELRVEVNRNLAPIGEVVALRPSKRRRFFDVGVEGEPHLFALGSGILTHNCRPNPPVGALGDKWRPATSDIVVACTSGKRYWDDLATRRPAQPQTPRHTNGPKSSNADHSEVMVGFDVRTDSNPAGSPLLDWWEIPPGGYSGAHYAVYPPALVEPLIAAMCPEKVCTECGEPSRRLVANDADTGGASTVTTKGGGLRVPGTGDRGGSQFDTAEFRTLGWSDCGHGSIVCKSCNGLVPYDYAIRRPREAPQIQSGMGQEEVLGEPVEGPNGQAEIPEGMRGLRSGVSRQDGASPSVQPLLFGEAGPHGGADELVRSRPGESSMEGRTEDPRRLRPDMGSPGVSGATEERLHDGASSSDAGTSGPSAGTDRMGSPPERDQGRQPDREPGDSESRQTRRDGDVSELRDGVPTPLDGYVCPCGSSDFKYVADHWRPGVVLDPFAGSGTTGMVATGRGHDAILIDLDERNADLAVDRIGPLLLEVEYPNPTRPRVP